MSKKPHERIFLQWEEWSEDSGVTWCQDQISETDVEYVRLDIYNRLLKMYIDLSEGLDEAHKKLMEGKR